MPSPSFVGVRTGWLYRKAGQEARGRSPEVPGLAYYCFLAAEIKRQALGSWKMCAAYW